MAAYGDTLDMSLFFGTEDEKKLFCDSLLRLLKERGCVKVQNHSIPDEEVHELFRQVRRFFNLPTEVKMLAKHPPKANPNRGYCYVGQENVAEISDYTNKDAKPVTTRDIKETVDFGSPTDDLVDNIWVPEEHLPGFRAFMESFYEKAFKTQLQLLTALATALGVPPSHLTSLHNRAENEFRILHYPAVPASEFEGGSATRIAEHTDFGTLTMLFQDATGGLQVEDQSAPGAFRDVAPGRPTDIILNIGDSLQRLTNDTFRAAVHRVTCPPSVEVGDGRVVPERYSVAYFGKPNRSASLFPLKNFITPETPCKYDEDVTAWEWNNRRIAKLFAAKA